MLSIRYVGKHKMVADPCCPVCRGKGEIMDERWHNGEYWYIFNDCDCWSPSPSRVSVKEE